MFFSIFSFFKKAFNLILSFLKNNLKFTIFFLIFAFWLLYLFFLVSKLQIIILTPPKMVNLPLDAEYCMLKKEALEKIFVSKADIEFYNCLVDAIEKDRNFIMFLDSKGQPEFSSKMLYDKVQPPFLKLDVNEKISVWEYLEKIKYLSSYGTGMDTKVSYIKKVGMLYRFFLSLIKG